MKRHQHSPASLFAGFTLIEMSIVLMIIGLITGGIIVGRSLIRQAEINSVAMDVKRYTQAVRNFQQKYNALPGDMTTATSYWGAMTTCPPTSGTASPGGTLTCNGDGNGQIGYGGQEIFLVWRHLVNAQMINGSYTGIPGSAGNASAVVGTNSPDSRVDGGGFSILWRGIMSGDTNYFDANYGHVFIFGAYQGNDVLYNSVLTTAEAMGVDQKYDDGLPAYGSILALKAGSVYISNCTTTSVSSTAVYKIASSGSQCSLIFISGF